MSPFLVLRSYQVLSSISVLDELCMGSQVYATTGPDFHDDISCGSMQLAHIGNGVSVESPSPNYMEYRASPLNNMAPAFETSAVSSGTPMASPQPQHTGPDHDISNIINRSRADKATSATTTYWGPAQHIWKQRQQQGPLSHQFHHSLFGTTTQHQQEQ